MFVKKLYELGFVVWAILLGACALIGYLSTKELGDDNVIEEVAESVIDEETGLHVNLSPKSSKKILPRTPREWYFVE